MDILSTVHVKLVGLDIKKNVYRMPLLLVVKCFKRHWMWYNIN